MNKFIIKIAGLNIEINCKYDFTFNLCKNYIIDSEDVDFVVKPTDDDINKYSLESSIETGEFIAIYEIIASQLYKYNRVLLHGAAIEHQGLGYLFIAPSGVGKSTHIKLWMENIEGVTVINGDKPIIDDNGYIYGTPWSGKEGWNTNKSTKLAGIVILYRDSYNHIEETTYCDNLSSVLNQVYKDGNFDISISIVDKAFKNIPIYKLGCTKDKEAAKICLDYIKNNR